MLVNNGERLTIWLSLKNKFDYAEFVTACKFAGIRPLDAMEFAQKAGIISTAMTLYPNLPVAEAYVRFVQESSIPKPTSNVRPPAQVYPAPETPVQEALKALNTTGTVTRCGGCGGGKVL